MVAKHPIQLRLSDWKVSPPWRFLYLPLKRYKFCRNTWRLLVQRLPFLPIKKAAKWQRARSWKGLRHNSCKAARDRWQRDLKKLPAFGMVLYRACCTSFWWWYPNWSSLKTCLQHAMYYVISIDAHIIACIKIYTYNIHCILQDHGYNPVFTHISFLRALRLRQGTVTSQRRSESLRDNLNKKAHKQVKLI